MVFLPCYAPDTGAMQRTSLQPLPFTLCRIKEQFPLSPIFFLVFEQVPQDKTVHVKVGMTIQSKTQVPLLV
ncbi:hypothetical protein DUNSADRAFT_9249 [Dunaliella salina]|uniref:Encoded protein n=1 Tax=Dunaliella salina TaxID=3046 RepID=A0ABQ7GHT8_DUNSA|nr:hypothetical protein DUNSADRAFT_9249 [Dunaliella salina]|eukprot:KAF5834174.1 hypothetical protein DUNSADRAFT_9249 [Dunaliella salina]